MEASQFHRFFKAVFQFLYDDANYDTNFRDLTNQFFSIAQGNSSETDVELFPNGNCQFAKDKIRNRIQAIEQRLIDQDSDTTQDRMKMRGEIEGLRFALAVMEQNY